MTLVNDLTFQLGDTGVVLNDDFTVGAPFIDIDKVSGLDSAPFRQTKRDHEGVDGGFMDAEFETGRDITLEGTLYGNGNPIEPVLDLLKANYAPSKTLVPFYFRSADVGTRFLQVKPLGVAYDWDSARRTGTTALRFSMYAEIPFLFDINQTSVTIPVGATVFTGFAFPLGFSFGFGGVSTTSDGENFFNTGNRPAPITFTMTGPLTNPTIISDTAGTHMDFNITLSATDTLTLDTYYRTVRLNGTANRRSLMTNAGWFQMLPGTNFIRFRSQAGTGTLNVTYRSAWR